MIFTLLLLLGILFYFRYLYYRADKEIEALKIMDKLRGIDRNKTNFAGYR